METVYKNQKGFSLVEIALVFVVVGLLIGGVLMGASIIKAARITATVQQINQLRVAVEGFKNQYGQLPGDFEDASTVIPGCGNVCDISNGGIEAGNGSVGTTDWDFKAFQFITLQNTKPFSSVLPSAETTLFWYELEMSKFISGWVDKSGVTGIYGTTPVFGESLPKAKVGGGFVVGNASGTYSTAGSALGRPDAAGSYPPLGTTVVILPQPDPSTYWALRGDDYSPLSPNWQALLPSVAAAIDRKIDDGMPASGKVQAFGTLNSCNKGIAAPFIYNEAVESKDCNLIISVSD